MGCDIHFYIEFKDKKGDGWSVIGTDLEDWRDYMAFGILAGVRDHNVEPISQPRGHVDIGLETRIGKGFGSQIKHKYGWDWDYHSHSWLNLAELKAYDWDSDGYEDPGVKDTWVYKKLIPEMHNIAAKLGVTDEQIRIVFCFDS